MKTIPEIIVALRRCHGNMEKERDRLKQQLHACIKASERDRLKQQLHACIKASTDVHERLAQEIDRLKAKLHDADEQREFLRRQLTVVQSELQKELEAKPCDQ